MLLLDNQVVALGWSHVGHRNLNAVFSVHAELHALGRAKHIDLSGAQCHTVTIRKTRTFAAIPCKVCAAALIKAGIQTVHTAGLEIDLLNSLKDLKLYSRPDAV